MRRAGYGLSSRIVKKYASSSKLASIIHLPPHSTEKNDLKRKHLQLETKCELLEEERTAANQTLLEAEQKVAGIQKDSTSQANYTAAMGSILGTMLWKTSKDGDAIETYFQEVSPLCF